MIKFEVLFLELARSSWITWMRNQGKKSFSIFGNPDRSMIRNYLRSFHRISGNLGPYLKIKRLDCLPSGIKLKETKQ